MNRLIKLTILLLLSLSVYFIYEQTKNKSKTIIVLGDNLSLGLNSYGIYDYSYVDYYKDFFPNKKINIIKEYSNQELTMKELLEEIKLETSIKKNLRDSNLLLLQLGYNDLVYKLSLEEKMTNTRFQKIIEDITSTYNNLIKEIKKYYIGNIIVVGYHESPKEDYYLNKGIKEINKILKNNNKIIYINTYELLKDRKKYFSNPNSYYPNTLGYKRIANEIITKTLEIERNI